MQGLAFVAAVKVESSPTSVSVGTLARRLDVPVFGGLGGIGLLDELAAGAAGAMTGYSFPEGLLACARLGRRRRRGSREAVLPHLPLVAFEQQPGIGLALRRACLQRRGLIGEAGVRPQGPRAARGAAGAGRAARRRRRLRVATDRVASLDAAAAQRTGRTVEQVAEEARGRIPAGRYGRPDEFGAVGAFLCSELAGDVTGVALRVDGGLVTHL